MVPPSLRTHDRAVTRSALALLVFGFAEEIAVRFVPALLRAMNASAGTIGLLGTARDLADALLAYPGGRLSDRWGPTRTLFVVGLVSVAGYALTALAPGPALVLVAAVLAMAWPAMGLVASVDVVARGPKEPMRAFSFQAAMRRVPMVLGPLLGATLVGRYGSLVGTRLAMGAATVLALVALVVFVRRLGSADPRPERSFAPLRTLREMHPCLRLLLAADTLVRFAEGLPDVFIVLFVLEQAKRSPQTFGLLIALRSLVSIASYWPGVRLAFAVRRELAVGLGFVAYAVFPLVLAGATSGPFLALAFVVAGLREFGEPARKALLVEHAGSRSIGDTLGTYLLVRGLLVSGAGYLGGLLYAVAPTLPFRVAAVVGFVGVALYAVGTIVLGSKPPSRFAG